MPLALGKPVRFTISVTASFLSTVEKHSRIGSIFSMLLTLSPFRLVCAEGGDAFFCEGRFLAALLRRVCAGKSFRISIRFCTLNRNTSEPFAI